VRQREKATERFQLLGLSPGGESDVFELTVFVDVEFLAAFGHCCRNNAVSCHCDLF